MISRRDFLLGCGVVGAGARLLARAEIRFACAAITWGGNDVQAIEDISAVGFRGIQIRSNAIQQFGSKPAALKDLLARHRLPMVAFSSGNVRVDPAAEQEDLATHTRHAAFVRDVGGLCLQVTDARPKPVAKTDYARLGKLLTELGKRTADLGVPLVYHHHMNALGEKPEEIDAILDATEPKFAKLLLDTAHYQQGGGDPVKAIRKYADRIHLLHIKDLESPAPDAPYRFVELGRGKVDLKGVFAALDAIGYRGWAVVELDRVPDPGRTPKESAMISKKYLEDQLKLKV